MTELESEKDSLELRSQVEKFGGKTESAFPSLVELTKQDDEIRKSIEQIEGNSDLNQDEKEDKVKSLKETGQQIRDNAQRIISEKIGGKPLRDGKDIINITRAISEARGEIKEAEKVGDEDKVKNLEKFIKEYEKDLFERADTEETSEFEGDTDESVSLPPEFIEPAKKQEKQEVTGKNYLQWPDGEYKEVPDHFYIPQPNFSGEKEVIKPKDKKEKTDFETEKGKNSKKVEKKARNEQVSSDTKGIIQGEDENILKNWKTDIQNKGFEKIYSSNRLPFRFLGYIKNKVIISPFKYVKNEVILPPFRAIRSFFRYRVSKENNWIENRQRQFSRPGQKLELALNLALLASKNKKLIALQEKNDATNQEIDGLQSMISEIDDEKESLEKSGNLRTSNARYFENQKLKISKKINKLKTQRGFLNADIDLLENSKKLRQEGVNLNVEEIISTIETYLAPLEERKEVLNYKIEESEKELAKLKEFIAGKENELSEIHKKIKADSRLKGIFKFRNERLKAEVERGKEIILSEEYKIRNYREKNNYLNNRIGKWQETKNNLLNYRHITETETRASNDVPADKIPSGAFDDTVAQ